MATNENEVIRKEYLDRRRPCFLCSKSLQMIPGGQYVAAIRMIDGLERETHFRCTVERSLREEDIDWQEEDARIKDFE